MFIEIKNFVFNIDKATHCLVTKDFFKIYSRQYRNSITYGSIKIENCNELNDKICETFVKNGFVKIVEQGRFWLINKQLINSFEIDNGSYCFTLGNEASQLFIKANSDNELEAEYIKNLCFEDKIIIEQKKGGKRMFIEIKNFVFNIDKATHCALTKNYVRVFSKQYNSNSTRGSIKIEKCKNLYDKICEIFVANGFVKIREQDRCWLINKRLINSFGIENGFYYFSLGYETLPLFIKANSDNELEVECIKNLCFDDRIIIG